jgi:hypothetical protein
LVVFQSFRYQPNSARLRLQLVVLAQQCPSSYFSRKQERGREEEKEGKKGQKTGRLRKGEWGWREKGGRGEDDRKRED